MFTGLVQGQGQIISIGKASGQSRMAVSPLFSVDKPEQGESIAVNGACLTVERWENNAKIFHVYASAESLVSTSLGDLQPGALVNLERALALGDRLGGHIVSGHVDTVALVASVSPVGESHCFRLEFDSSWSSHIIPKGSITLDGISLTVNRCGPGFLEVNIIPETWQTTTIRNWRPGSRVNMETDIIGKYVSNLVQPYTGGEASETTSAGGLTFEFLRQHGF